MYRIGTALISLALLTTWPNDATAQAPDKDQYVESSDAAGLGDVAGYGRGVAFVDINSDGFDDLFVADTDDRHRTNDFGVSQMYLNQQDGTFAAVDVGISPDDLIGTWVGSFAD